MGARPVDGAPIFDDYVDNKEVLRGLSKYDTYTRVLEASGNREPTISGSLNTTVRWKNFRFSGSFAYSMGNKIRLFAMYSPEADATMNANEIRAENNVGKDILRRWQKPGDETLFKGLNNESSTYATTRFVQDERTLIGQNLYVSYEFLNNPWLQKRLGIRTLTISGDLSDLFYWSTIKQERGLSYPFSRRFSFSLSMRF